MTPHLPYCIIHQQIILGYSVDSLLLLQIAGKATLKRNLSPFRRVWILQGHIFCVPGYIMAVLFWRKKKEQKGTRQVPFPSLLAVGDKNESLADYIIRLFLTSFNGSPSIFLSLHFLWDSSSLGTINYMFGLHHNIHIRLLIQQQFPSFRRAHYLLAPGRRRRKNPSCRKLEMSMSTGPPPETADLDLEHRGANVSHVVSSTSRSSIRMASGSPGGGSQGKRVPWVPGSTNLEERLRL